MVSVKSIINTSIGITVLFLLMSTVTLTHFNTAYNYAVTGLASATIEGLMVLVLILGILGFIMLLLAEDHFH